MEDMGWLYDLEGPRAGHDFERGVLASLKLKMELCPMAEYTAPIAPEVGIV
jgi:hypothetical protein